MLPRTDSAIFTKRRYFQIQLGEIHSDSKGKMSTQNQKVVILHLTKIPVKMLSEKALETEGQVENILGWRFRTHGPIIYGPYWHRIRFLTCWKFEINLIYCS